MENINLLVTPVINVFLEKRFLYTLTDSVYGEWIIFKNDEPVYYLYIFDCMYDEYRATIDAITSIEDYLNKRLPLIEVGLSLHQHSAGIQLTFRSVIKSFALKKLPAVIFK